MRVLQFQRTDLKSRKQRLHLGLLVAFGLLLMLGTDFTLMSLDESSDYPVRLSIRKWPTATLGPGANPGLSAGAYKNGSSRVYALQLTGSKTTRYLEVGFRK